MSAQAVPIRVGGRVVGQVRADTFHKSLRASVHFLRTPAAICFDVSTLDDAEKAGALFCEVLDSESGHKYRAPMATIRARGFPVNRQYGRQVGLLLREWSKDGEPPAPPAQPAAPAPQQKSLFGNTA